MASEPIYIKNSSIYYYVDTETGTVIAVMDTVRQEIMKNVNKFKRQTNEVGKLIIEYYMRQSNVPRTLKGKATCGENDEFDLEFGMKLARERLLHKYYDVWTGIVVRMNNEVEDFFEVEDETLLKALKNTIRFKNPGGFWKEDFYSEDEVEDEDSEEGAPTIETVTSDENSDDAAAEIEDEVEENSNI